MEIFNNILILWNFFHNINDGIFLINKKNCLLN